MKIIMKNITGYFCDGKRITADEYETLLTEIKEKASYVNKIIKSELTITDVPEKWQEEIQHRVNEYFVIQEKSKLTEDEIIEDNS